MELILSTIDHGLIKYRFISWQLIISTFEL